MLDIFESSHGLTPKQKVEGDELIFAFEASDGTPISFTANQLLAALGLKTINNESIRGTGNITVGSNETASSIIQKLSVDPVANKSFLPDVNFFQFFDPDQFAVVNGKIRMTGGAPAPYLSTPVLTATVISPNQINLSWTTSVAANGASEVSNYIVEKSTDSTFATGVTGAYNGIDRSVQVTGLAASTHYYFRVRSSNVTPIYSAYGTANATTQANGGGADTSLITGFTRMNLLLPQKLSAGSNATASGNKYIAQSGEFNTETPYKLPIGAYAGIVITAATNVSLRVHNAYNLFGSGSYNFQYSGGMLTASVDITAQPVIGDKVLFLRSGSGNGVLTIVKTSDNGASYVPISASMQLFNDNQWMGFDIQSNGEVSDPQISTVLLDPTA